MSGTRQEDDDEFYESLDRILSSSCSSTSASDDESNHRRSGRHEPELAVSYDAWMSEPSTVEERRRSLLQQMGLADDRALARRRSSPPREDCVRALPREVEVVRSDSCNIICGRPEPQQDPPDSALAVTPAVGRSRSDGRVDRLTSIQNGLPASSKPPLVTRLPSRSEDLVESDVSEEEEFSDPRFLIRSLDDGKEFLVREDGSWDRVKDVSTGQHLTMEEFEMCVGRSPIVQELMRRQSIEGSMDSGNSGNGVPGPDSGSRPAGWTKHKKKGGWLRSIKNVAGSVVTGRSHRERRSSDEKDTSSEKGGRRSSSATDDSQDGPRHLPEKIKVRSYGKTHKELTALYLNQEIRAHKGSIWSIKFSLDGRFLASAGEDCVVHVWQVSEYVRKEDLFLENGSEECRNGSSSLKAITNGSSELTLASADGNHSEKKRGKVPGLRKPLSSDQLTVPENVFALSETPICSFKGHHADVLDLSWSKSQYLLSSSMDKTVRLWHMSSASCLKTFSHSDYVTCIQFNPVDDRYFISGSLDEKVRLWSIPDRQVVDWNDLHEMVTSACYTPDGQGAFVGSHKGSCYLYEAAENKLQLKCQVDLQNKKKRSNQKKITGFQFAPGSSSELLVTSADSRIRVIDGSELVHKFKGFRNTSSQISASFTTKGNYVICAGEDSQVYIWRHETDSRPRRSKGIVSITQSYEFFQCQDVTVAVPWPRCGYGEISESPSNKKTSPDGAPKRKPCVPPRDSDSSILPSIRPSDCGDRNSARAIDTNPDLMGDRGSATWPEENLVRTPSSHSPLVSTDICDCATSTKGRSAWGLVIVTAGRGGDIKTYQNFGFPIRV